MGKYHRKTNRPFRKIGMVLTLEWFKSQSVLDLVTGCWNWTHCLSKEGYARVSESGRPQMASRIILRLKTGLIFKGKEMDACHTCDNPACVNPEHLWWGTRKENLWDSKRKGRARVGVNAYQAKLTTLDVWHIRRHTEGVLKLARWYDIGHSAIGRIIQRKAYRSVPEQEGVEMEGVGLSLL